MLTQVYSKAILRTMLASLVFLCGALATAYGQSSSGYPEVPDIHPGLAEATQQGHGGL